MRNEASGMVAFVEAFDDEVLEGEMVVDSLEL